MSYLKNPIGIRGGKILVIGDLDESERGKKCNCCCPHCNGRFIARMGNEKVHHFAHDGAVKNCSDELALLSGLYKFLKQFVDEGNAIRLPQIDLYCSFENCVGQITKENYKDYVKINKDIFHEYPINNIVKQSNLIFDSSEIEYDSSKKPLALVLHKGSKRMAIIIRVPKKKCREYYISKVDWVTEYKDMPTLLLDIFNMDLEETKNTEYFYSIFKDDKKYKYHYKYKWISNSQVIIKNIDRINKEKNKYIQEKERIDNERKAEEERINNKYFKEQVRIYNERKAEKERKKNEKRKTLAEITKKEKEQQRKEEERINKEREELFFNTMKRYYKENNLGEPNLNQDGKYNFVVMFCEKYGSAERGENELGYYEVKDLFTQQDTVISDHWGKRWRKCTVCGKVKRDKEFKKRGEENHINEGLCEDCYRQKTYLNLKSIKDMVE